MEIEENRRRTDALDQEIVRLLIELASCAQLIGAANQRTGSAAYAPDRERLVLEKVTGINPGPLPAGSIQAIYREVMSACRALEHRLTVAYWGPPASNTHVAARQRFGTSVDFLETGSVAEVFSAVERGSAQFGVIPVENSTEGVVSRTLDMLLQTDLEICAEVYVDIQHNLLSRGNSLADLSRVYTMFQATAQCREWINRNLSHVELVETSTTARGAALAAEDPETGAIANLAAAEQ